MLKYLCVSHGGDMRSFKYAVEMGGYCTTIYKLGEGVVLKEPTLVCAKPSGDGYEIVALGEGAKNMVGKTADNVDVFTPISSGVISNFEYTSVLLHYFLGKVGFKEGFDSLLMVVPSGVTVQDKQKLSNLCESVGARDFVLVPAVICAVIGAGREIGTSHVNMVVDIGGTECEVGVLNMNTIVKAVTLYIGGRGMDVAISNYIAYKKGLVIGLPTAENLKEEVASLYDNDDRKLVVGGVDIETKTPRTEIINSACLRPAIRPYIDEIIRVMDTSINLLPPEMTADIISSKILLTGGVTCLAGLKYYIETNLKYPVEIADDPKYCTIMGAGKLISNPEKLQNILENL